MKSWNRAAEQRRNSVADVTGRDKKRAWQGLFPGVSTCEIGSIVGRSCSGLRTWKAEDFSSVVFVFRAKIEELGAEAGLLKKALRNTPRGFQSSRAGT